VIVGVVGLVDATAAWWVTHPEIPRDRLADELTDEVWLIIDRTSRRLGLALDPDAPLPAL
jgi:hypothetical protein